MKLLQLSLRLFRSFQSLFPVPHSRTSVRPFRSLQRVELLETRRLLAISQPVLESNGDISITGSASDNVVLVSRTDTGDVNVWQSAGNDVLNTVFSSSQVSRVIFIGGPGNDRFTNLTDVSSIAYGYGGNDVLLGGSSHDVLIGGTGLDEMYGNDGNDRLQGGEGDDFLSGDNGTDALLGGTGNDSIRGGEGSDVLNGEDGEDTLFGENGNDILYGGADNDIIYGEAGNDRLEGNEGDDQLFGADGNDLLIGQDGNDFLDAGQGNDILIGMDGNDDLHGFGGRDTIYGGRGDDNLTGGTEDDLLLAGNGNDIVRGESGNDTIYGEGGNDQLIGGSGDDAVFGGSGDDTLQGESGNDTLRGNSGHDTLSGEDGLDNLNGDAGDDVLFGGDGNDILRGSGGVDTLRGESGDDTLYGGTENDELFGGDGADTLLGENGADTLAGGNGNDALYGQTGDDLMQGDAGNDMLYGGEGDDNLHGGAGNDTLLGDIGNDVLHGQADQDILHGEEGNDQLYGEDGIDELYGSIGNDTLHGGAGDDLLEGEEGDDLLLGYEGNDLLRGGFGNDEIHGHEGNDQIFGGFGDDSLFGEAGSDLILGESGVDFLVGSTERDLLIGGTDADHLVGNDGDDILIGGAVTLGVDDLALALTAWNSPLSYEIRIASLQVETNPVHLVLEHTVFDDYVADEVYGLADNDWFFMPGAVYVYDAANVVNGLVLNEEQTGATHTHSSYFIDSIPVTEGFDFLDSIDEIRDAESNEVVTNVIPHSDDLSKQPEHLTLNQLVRYDQVTHIALSNGNWSNSSTWQNGIVPTNDARVLVPYGVNVIVDSELPARLKSVRVDGTLSFASNSDTELLAETVAVTATGTLRMGSVSSPIQSNVTARLQFIDNGALDRNADPFGLGRGLITHGTVEMYGADVASYRASATDLSADTTSITLTSAPTGWKVGDKLVIAGTSPDSLEDEVRTILAINGNTVTINPLDYDHETPSSEAQIHIANLTRNIVLESENYQADRRGHVMFMHNDDVNIHNAAFKGLGRTDKSIRIDDPVVDEDWNLIDGTGTNPRARYSVHFHRAGTVTTGAAAQVHGSVVDHGVGWGYVNHSSHVDFVDNVSFDVLGAGFVTEVGDETGSFQQNLSLHNKASGDLREDRFDIQDFAHEGQGFWFQGGGVRVVNNIAASNEGQAFTYYTRGLRIGNFVGMFDAANLADPSIANGADKIDVQYVPILEFSDNEGYASDFGLTVFWNLRNAPHNSSSVVKDSLFWNNEVGVGVEYAHNIIVRDIDVMTSETDFPAYGLFVNTVSKDITFDGVTVSDYYYGVDAGERGFTLIKNASFATRVGILARGPFEENRTVLVQGTFTMLPLFDSLGKALFQEHIVASYAGESINSNVSNYFYSSKIILDYGPYQQQQLYSQAQARNAIPFPVGSVGIPEQYVGLTSQQIFDNFGLIVNGEFAPSSVTTIPEFDGLLGIAPIQVNAQSSKREYTQDRRSEFS